MKNLQVVMVMSLGLFSFVTNAADKIRDYQCVNDNLDPIHFTLWDSYDDADGEPAISVTSYSGNYRYNESYDYDPDFGPEPEFCTLDETKSSNDKIVYSRQESSTFIYHYQVVEEFHLPVGELPKDKIFNVKYIFSQTGKDAIYNGGVININHNLKCKLKK